MPHPDERALRCMHMLRAEEFKPLLAYWTACRKDKVESLVDSQDDYQTKRLQGEVRMFTKLLDDVEQSAVMLQKVIKR